MKDVGYSHRYPAERLQQRGTRGRECRASEGGTFPKAVDAHGERDHKRNRERRGATLRRRGEDPHIDRKEGEDAGQKEQFYCELNGDSREASVDIEVR